MVLAKQAIYIFEGNSYEHFIDNFINKVKSIAKIYDVEITTNMDSLRNGLVNFMDYNYDIKTFIRKLKSEIDKNIVPTESIDAFRKEYMRSCLALIQILKRVNPNKPKVEWDQLIQLLAGLKVEEI